MLHDFHSNLFVGNAHLAEGLATTLTCFSDFEALREKTPSQKHCILIANSIPYSLPVQDSIEYEGKTYDQLTQMFVEVSFFLLADRNRSGTNNFIKLF